MGTSGFHIFTVSTWFNNFGGHCRVQNFGSTQCLPDLDAPVETLRRNRPPFPNPVPTFAAEGVTGGMVMAKQPPLGQTRHEAYHGR